MVDSQFDESKDDSIPTAVTAVHVTLLEWPRSGRVAFGVRSVCALSPTSVLLIHSCVQGWGEGSMDEYKDIEQFVVWQVG